MAKVTSNIDKLANLLALAEGAGATGPEADLAMERAIRFASTHSIDLTLARAHQRGKQREVPEKRRTRVGTPGKNNNGQFMDLFTNIAMVNDLKCLIGGATYQRGEGFDRDRYDPRTGEMHYEYVSGYRTAPSITCTAYGFPSDHEVTEKIYAVAVTLMVNAANKGIRQGLHKQAELGYGMTGAVSAKTWRTEFYRGFIARLNGRMWDAKRAAERAAGVASEDSEGTALVLADKKKEVDDFYREENPHFYRSDGTENGNVKAWKAGGTDAHIRGARQHGQAAADDVNLTGDGREIGSASTMALGGA